MVGAVVYWACLAAAAGAASTPAKAATEPAPGLAPAASPSASSNVTWASELQLASLGAIDELLAQPLGDMPSAVMDDKSVRPIKTCKDILALSKQSFHLSPDNNLAWESLASESVRCSALDVLKSAKPATTSYLGWFRFSKAGIAKLPARFTLAYSDDAEKALVKADTACKPWGKYDPSLKVRVKGDEGEVKTDGWTGRVVLYARGDLNGDGVEDLMFLREGQVEGGTASATNLLIVTQTSAKACPRIVRTLPESLGGAASR